uniref:Uncharacterized protein n=1 Tax=Wuchereria bancrofti TaxID=6293 RepID=A0A1I8EJ09_WUCBA
MAICIQRNQERIRLRLIGYTVTSSNTGSGGNTIAVPATQQTVLQFSSTSASKDIINPSDAE